MTHPITVILAKAGITVNGSKPFDIQVKDNRFYDEVLKRHSLGLGESYMKGWWECKSVDSFMTKILSAKIDKQLTLFQKMKLTILAIKHTITNPQTIQKSKKVGKQHYDIGNDFYKDMLGKSMTYTCAYWKNAKSLTQAQKDKYELICKKLKLKKGMKILDIGCGWGSFLAYAQNKYKIKGIGITISKEQKNYAEKVHPNIEIRLQDYRYLNEKFDAIVSIGMFEHVGPKNYDIYFKKAYQNLKPNGVFLLHTIATNTETKSPDKWISTYIFPGGHLPSLTQMYKSSEKLFITEDVQNLGPDYDKTLMSWHKNFKKHWPKYKKTYGDTFYRMWEYYLLSCAAGFRSRNIQLYQVVYSKERHNRYDRD